MRREQMRRAQRHIERAQAIYAFGAPIINILNVIIDYTPSQVDAQGMQRETAISQGAFKDTLRSRFSSYSHIEVDDDFFTGVNYDGQGHDIVAEVSFRLTYTGEISEEDERHIRNVLCDAYAQAAFLAQEDVHYEYMFVRDT